MSQTVGAAQVAAPGRRTHWSVIEDTKWGWIFILPLFIGVTIFYLYPIVQNFIISLTKPSVFGDSSTFVGVENYAKAVSDPALGSSLINTLLYTGILMLGIPIAVVFASLIALPGLKFAQFYRLAFFMPYLAMPTAIALVWRLIYSGEFGILNQALRSIGVKSPPHWIATPGVAIFAVAIVGLWASIGYNMIILFAGLQAIPGQLYEAARIDGASGWVQFIRITLPLLSPSIFFLLVMQAINGFQVFDLLFAIMGQRNPALPTTRSLVYMFYNEAFVVNNKGYAAAIAMIILVFVGIITAIQFKLQKRWVNYLD